jgi:integrase
VAIKRRKDRGNKWEASYRDADGKERTKLFARRAEADGWLASEKAKIARGEWVDPRSGQTTYKDWCETYFAGANKRATTLARDQTVNEKHFLPTLGNRRLASIRPLDVQKVVAAMTAELAPRTVRTNYGVLRAIMNAAVANDLIARSPCRNVRLPEIRDVRVRVNFSDVGELHRLADEMKAEYRPAVYLGALGLRQAEVFGLRVGAIDFARGTLTVAETLNEVNGNFVTGTGKTRNSIRTFEVPVSVLDLLGRHLREHDRLDSHSLVIQAPNGGPLRATNFRNRVWIPACIAAGLGKVVEEETTKKKRYTGLTFHRLRHFAIQSMRDAGVPLEVASRRVGHSTIRVTADVYDSVSASSDRAAASKLDAYLAGGSSESRGPNADQDAEAMEA